MNRYEKRLQTVGSQHRNLESTLLGTDPRAGAALGEKGQDSWQDTLQQVQKGTRAEITKGLEGAGEAGARRSALGRQASLLAARVGVRPPAGGQARPRATRRVAQRCGDIPLLQAHQSLPSSWRPPSPGRCRKHPAPVLRTIRVRKDGARRGPDARTLARHNTQMPGGCAQPALPPGGPPQAGDAPQWPVKEHGVSSSYMDGCPRREGENDAADEAKPKSSGNCGEEHTFCNFSLRTKIYRNEVTEKN